MKTVVGHAWLYALMVFKTLANPLRDQGQSVLIDGQLNPSTDGSLQSDCSASIGAKITGENIHAVASIDCVNAVGSSEKIASFEPIVVDVGSSVDIQVLSSGYDSWTVTQGDGYDGRDGRDGRGGHDYHDHHDHDHDHDPPRNGHHKTITVTMTITSILTSTTTSVKTTTESPSTITLPASTIHLPPVTVTESETVTQPAETVTSCPSLPQPTYPGSCQPLAPYTATFEGVEHADDLWSTSGYKGVQYALGMGNWRLVPFGDTGRAIQII
ncbi:hypothetical protein EPUS_06492 [Endocarpon pusillum Z07020]|uniref:Uncharacterized protein n=1 Tax=Endocarpon pusillum (strain Z07020 / HMAS-L-300199) TaxID=1263415 RepID=U1GIH2_ENDPU|nr:uncharacterized protein EPUS_06492 [Endocarpon pusillum Z07020]ERF71933.1 hypothetical protein EPUS_06492 [Endocarpon pusillum Z07020]